MLTISRRDFLKGSVAIGVAGALGDVVFNTLKPSKAYADEQNPAGTEIMYRPTHCLGCTSWCALEAVVQKDTSTNIHRVVDVTGNRKDGRVSGEWNGDIGFACPRAKLSIQEFYDPDRLKAPLRRTNPNKGRYVNPQFVADTWDNALNDIAKELIKIRYTPDPYDLRLTGTIESVNGQTITATKDAIGNTIIANSTSDYYKGMIFVCGDVKRMIANSSVDANGRLTLTISSETELADGDVVVGSPFEIRPSQAHKVMTNRGRYSYPLENILYSNFASILGTPNKVSHSSLCAEAEKTAWAMVEGKFTYMDYDIENTKYMLLWGVDPLSSNRMVSAAIQRIANKLANDPDFKITVIDPRLSPIAAKAHRWLPIKPGTDGALALAIAYHILSNSDLVDPNNIIKIKGDDVLKEFVDIEDSKRTFGLKRYWEYLTGGIDGITKTTAWAANETGLDEVEIKKVACEFAGYVPDENGDPTTTRMPGRDGEGICHAMSWTGPGVAMAPNGVYGGAAAAALNGLIGSFDHKGGIFSKTASISGTGSVPTPGDSHKDPISNAKYSYYRTNERKYATYDNLGPRVNTDPKIPFDMIAMNGDNFSIGATTPTNRVADALKHKMPYTQVTYQSGVGEVDLGTVAPNNCRMVIAYMNNWVFSATGVQRWEEGLKNVGKLVHITTNVSEFSMFADWVLPSDHHCFENYLASPSKANFHNTIAIGRPVAPVGADPNPQLNKLWGSTYWPETEFVYKLAEKMWNGTTGIKVGDVVSGWKDGTADYYFKKLWDYVQSVGSPASAWDFNKNCIKKYATNQYSDSDPIWSKIDSDDPADFTDLGTGQAYGFGIRTGDLNQQGWFDNNGRGQYWRGVSNFSTASGRIEFSCRDYNNNALNTKIRTSINDFITKPEHWANRDKTWKDVIAAQKYETTAYWMVKPDNDDPKNDIAFMPHWEEPNIAGSESEYPFILVDHKSRLNREGRSQNCPWYYEFKVCDTEDERNLDVVKVHPSIPIQDGARVKIISPNASSGLVCILRKSYGVPKGVAVKCYGQGHWAYGRYASKLIPDGNPKLNTANNNQIMQAEFERLSGSNARNAVTRVKIVPA